MYMPLFYIFKIDTKCEYNKILLLDRASDFLGLVSI